MVFNCTNSVIGLSIYKPGMAKFTSYPAQSDIETSSYTSKTEYHRAKVPGSLLATYKEDGKQFHLQDYDIW